MLTHKMLTNAAHALLLANHDSVLTKLIHYIIELPKQAGAKLVLVGAPAQLQSVEAGAAFRNLLERNNYV